MATRPNKRRPRQCGRCKFSVKEQLVTKLGPEGYRQLVEQLKPRDRV